MPPKPVAHKKKATTPEEPLHVGTWEVRDVEVDIFYIPSKYGDGSFKAHFNDQTIWGATEEAVVERLKLATKKARITVAVPFTQIVKSWGKWQVKEGIASGLHATNRNILVTWIESNQSEQVEGYSFSSYYQSLSDEDLAELIRLKEVNEAAQEALNEFEKTHRFNLREAVEEAIEERMTLGTTDPTTVDLTLEKF
jgi:hypothetical protein